MVAPSVGNVTATTSATGTAVTGTVPASVVNNSVVIVVVYSGGSTVTGLGTTGLVHAPGSPLLSQPGGNANINILWKRSNGTEPGSYALTLGTSQFWTSGAARIDNAVTSGSPWDTNSGTGTALNNANSANSLTTSMTTGGATELLFNVAGQFTGGTWTQPSGFTKDFTDSVGTVLYFAHLAQSAAGSTGTLTTSVSGVAAQMADWLGAVLPIAGAAVAIPTNNPVRRRVQAPRRRPKASQVVPAQVIVPPFRAVQVKEARTIRGRLYRRGHAVTPVPAQVATPPPAYALRPVRVRLRAALVKRMRNDMPPVDQTPAPVPQPPRRRGSIVRRGRTVQVVPAQVTQINPPYPPVNLRVRVRGALSRRGHAVTPVPAQVTPPVVTWTPTPVRVRLRAALARRGRVVSPPATDTRVPLLARIRARLVPPRRGKTRTPVPPQVVVAPPAYPPQPVHRTRRGLRRRTHNVEGWMVGSAQQNCDTPRPFTGITARPGSGTTAYSTATTARPGSGTTTRPDSGETDPPCG